MGRGACVQMKRLVGNLSGWALILAVCVAAGCGFHLRTWGWADQEMRVHVRANARNSLAEPLRRALRQAGVPVSATAAEADFVIHLLNERRSRRIASVAVGARAAEYELQARAQYAIRAGARELIPPTWVEAVRVFSIDRTSLTGSSEEQALIEQELESDLVQNVLRGLNAVASARQRSGSP